MTHFQDNDDGCEISSTGNEDDWCMFQIMLREQNETWNEKTAMQMCFDKISAELSAFINRKF